MKGRGCGGSPACESEALSSDCDSATHHVMTWNKLQTPLNFSFLRCQETTQKSPDETGAISRSKSPILLPSWFWRFYPFFKKINSQKEERTRVCASVIKLLPVPSGARSALLLCLSVQRCSAVLGLAPAPRVHCFHPLHRGTCTARLPRSPACTIWRPRTLRENPSLNGPVPMEGVQSVQTPGGGCCW